MQFLPRRSFLISSGVAILAARTVGKADAQPAAKSPADGVGHQMTYPFVLPPLPYAYDANEPTIDKPTMQLHHDKHHAAYVANLNAALKDQTELHSMSLRVLLGSLDHLPVDLRKVVRNNAGGHAYHTMFWQIMGGRGGEPSGDLAAAIIRDFGSFKALKTGFGKAGTSVFGSGWAVVLTDRTGKLTLATRPNQDSPIMDGLDVVFGNDVWEHAYYLKYQNRRPDYLAAWWDVLDWSRIGDRYEQAREGTLVV